MAVAALMPAAYIPLQLATRRRGFRLRAQLAFARQRPLRLDARRGPAYDFGTPRHRFFLRASPRQDTHGGACARRRQPPAMGQLTRLRATHRPPLLYAAAYIRHFSLTYDYEARRRGTITLLLSSLTRGMPPPLAAESSEHASGARAMRQHRLGYTAARWLPISCRHSVS